MSDRSRKRRAPKRDADAPTSRATNEQVGEDVDDASEASFPASDPPAWMGMPPGGPSLHGDARPADRQASRKPDD